MWHLRVDLEDVSSEDGPAVLAWVKDALLPAVMHAPVPMSVRFTGPHDRGEHEGSPEGGEP